MKSIIFGAGKFGKLIYSYYKSIGEDIICFVDNNYKNINSYDNIDILSPEQVLNFQFDEIVISLARESFSNDIKKQLLELNINENKIKQLIYDDELKNNLFKNVNKYDENDNRVNWLREYASLIYDRKINGSVAECGVNRGDFAFYINKYFHDRKLYLFDTFEGFDARDLNIERTMANDKFMNGEFNHNEWFKLTSVDLVISKMSNKDNCEIRKGYFPETAKGINDKFCFVNLDMDLYQPTYEGLLFFYNRMSKGGVILLHDYFQEELPGIKKAVRDFEKSLVEELKIVPISDNCSIAIIK